MAHGPLVCKVVNYVVIYVLCVCLPDCSGLFFFSVLIDCHASSAVQIIILCSVAT